MGGREDIARLRVAYGILLDPDAVAAAPSGRVIEVDSARPPSFLEMRTTVIGELRKAPDAHGVEIRVDG